MRNPTLAALAAAIGLASSIGALADPISMPEYQATKKNIASDFKNARIGCEPMPAHVRDVCLADVNGREDVASAELEFAYNPGPKSRYALRIAKAHADLAIARDRCLHKPEVAKDVCLKEAEAVGTSTRADAETQLKMAEAGTEPGEKAPARRGDAARAK